MKRSELEYALPPELVAQRPAERRDESRLLVYDRASGGEAEVLLLEPLNGRGEWEGLARPSRRLRAGERLGPVELLEPLGEGRWRLRLDGEPAGEAPLPPYITAPLADPQRYQTVYAAEEGSA